MWWEGSRWREEDNGCGGKGVDGGRRRVGVMGREKGREKGGCDGKGEGVGGGWV